MSSNVERLCANPSCMNIGKHLCTGCGEELYCSRDCQKAHWSTHKLACKTAMKPEAAALMKSFDSLSVKQLKNVMKAKAATFDKKKRDAILDKLENIVEKVNLVKLVREHVNPAEVEGLLSVPQSTASSSGHVPPTTSSSSKKRSNPAPKYDFKTTTPTPAQMREQAAWIRKNPDTLRKAQPAFASLTDEQIMQYADQLDQAASDPNMMKEVERMAQLSPDERNLLQTVQEGVSGVKPIDAKWINTVVKAFKKKPQTFKNLLQGRGAMLGGVSDEQIQSFIDMLARMDLFTLKCIAYGIWYLASAVKPLGAAYKMVDDYTFGSARYITLIVVCVMLYYVSYFLFLFVRVVFKYAYIGGMAAYRMLSPAQVTERADIPTPASAGGAGEAAAGSSEFDF